MNLTHINPGRKVPAYLLSNTDHDQLNLYVVYRKEKRNYYDMHFLLLRMVFVDETIVFVYNFCYLSSEIIKWVYIGYKYKHRSNILT